MTCATLVFLLAITSACTSDYEETRLAAEQGDADAQFTLGKMYQDGEGVEPDEVEAIRWHRLAAEKGHADAQAALTTLHDLQLSGGPPSRGFFTRLPGFATLPPGTLPLSPDFEPSVTAYTAYNFYIPQPQLTIEAKAASGMTVRTTGTAAGGAELKVYQSAISVNDAVQFLRVALDGLEEGENTIRISVSGPTYTGPTYRVVVTFEP